MGKLFHCTANNNTVNNHHSRSNSRWCDVREELLQHPNGLDMLRRGAPVPVGSPGTAPTSPTVSHMLIDLEPAPPVAPESPRESQLPGYKAKRPAALQVQGLETYHSLRSLQAPFAETPLTAYSAKRRRMGDAAQLLVRRGCDMDKTWVAMCHVCTVTCIACMALWHCGIKWHQMADCSYLAQDVGVDAALARTSSRSVDGLHPSASPPVSPTASLAALDMDGMEGRVFGRSRSASMDGASASATRRSTSRSVGRRGAASQPFRQQSLHLGDVLSSRDAHSEAGTEYYDPAGDVFKVAEC